MSINRYFNDKNKTSSKLRQRFLVVIWLANIAAQDGDESMRVRRHTVSILDYVRRRSRLGSSSMRPGYLTTVLHHSSSQTNEESSIIISKFVRDMK